VTSQIKNLTFDCADPRALALFWANALGYDAGAIEEDEDDGLAYVGDASGARPGLLFIIVPEGKTAKNRIHFDVSPSTTRDQEVERILALGATIADDRRLPDGKGWVVMNDPEGNEFCVERSEAERAQPGP
jgi:hypothetical protein